MGEIGRHWHSAAPMKRVKRKVVFALLRASNAPSMGAIVRSNAVR